MPGLKNLYGRDWNHGSDDLAVPSFLCCLTRTAWLAIGMVIYFTKDISERCTEDEMRFNKMSSVAFGVTWATYIAMFIVANRGSVIEVERRWAMPNIIRLLVICLFVEFGLTIFGTLAIARAGDGPDSRTTYTTNNSCYDLMNAVVIGSWVEISITSCCGSIAFSFSSRAKVSEDDEGIRDAKKKKTMKRTPLSSSRRGVGGTGRLKGVRRRCGYCWGESAGDDADEEGEDDDHDAYRVAPTRDDVEAGRSRRRNDSQSGSRTNKRRIPSGNERDDNADDDEDDALMERDDADEAEEEDHYEFNSDEERESDRPKYDILSHLNASSTEGVNALDLASPFILHKAKEQSRRLLAAQTSSSATTTSVSSSSASEGRNHVAGEPIEAATTTGGDGDDDEDDEEEVYDYSAKKWQKRCLRLCSFASCCTCGLFGGISMSGGPEAFQQVGMVLSGWFKGLELVPSDIVAALFMMRAEQRDMEKAAIAELRKKESETVGSSSVRSRYSLTHVGRWMWAGRNVNARAKSMIHAQALRSSRDARLAHNSSSTQNSYSNSPRTVASSTMSEEGVDEEAIRIMLEAYDLMPFMLGMYGWMLYGYMHGVKGWAGLLRRGLASCLRCRCCCRRQRSSKSRKSTITQSLVFRLCCFPCWLCANRASRLHGLGISQEGNLSPSSGGVEEEEEDDEDEEEEFDANANVISIIRDDSWCGLNRTALLQNAGRRGTAKAEIVYASFEDFQESNSSSSRNSRIPYCIAVDHERRRVIVACRGELNLTDAILTSSIIPAPLMPHAKRWGFEEDVENTSYCHAGLLDVASWMREDLQERDVLHRLFGISRFSSSTQSSRSSSYLNLNPNPNAATTATTATTTTTTTNANTNEENEESTVGENEENDFLEIADGATVENFQAEERKRRRILAKKMKERLGTDGNASSDAKTKRKRVFSLDPIDLPDCRGYALEITGHSLGAGVGAVLSLFLRPAFPHVRCIAISPPGCVFDWKLANKSDAWITSLFVGKDFLPRMSWQSLFKLRGQILDSLRRSKVPKSLAIASFVVGFSSKFMLHRPDSVPDTESTRNFQKKIDELAERKEAMPILDEVKLYLPGKILHLTQIEDDAESTSRLRSFIDFVLFCCRRPRARYIPMWVDDRSVLDEVLLSTRMATDHFPDLVSRAITSVVEDYGLSY